jgi:hypothetical protein
MRGGAARVLADAQGSSGLLSVLEQQKAAGNAVTREVSSPTEYTRPYA